MILTTTCNAEEFEAIRAAAIRSGLQVTAAPGFIYKKGNWIVGGTQESEADFNERITSESMAPAEFMKHLFKKEEHIRSMFIVCKTMLEVNQVIEYFIEKRGFRGLPRRIIDGLAVCVVPAEETVMITFKYVARENAKEGYTTIDFETFKTIAG